MWGKLRQVQTALAASLGGFMVGMYSTWPSYTLNYFTDNSTTLVSSPFTEMEGSLLGSLPALGAMTGTVTVGYTIDKLGRRISGAVLSLLFLVSWALIEVSSSSTLILLARFLVGVSGGAHLVYDPLFISEVAEDSIRGALTSLPMTMNGFGALFSYTLGWTTSYRVTVWLNLVLSVLTITLPMTLIESPVYLLSKKRKKESLRALARYRGVPTTSKELIEEFSRLQQRIHPTAEIIPASNSNLKAEQTEKERLHSDIAIENFKKILVSPLKVLYTSRASRRAFIIIFSIFGLQVMMGIVAVQVYAKVLFAKAAPSLSSHFCSVLFAMCLASGGVITSTLSDKAGRRFLIITSSCMVGLCMISLGVLIQTEIAPPWVSAVLLLVYCISFNSGSRNIPYVLLAECFMPEVQSLASMLLLEWVWFLNFLIIGIFPYMTKYLGVSGSFYIFAFFGFSNCICSYLIVPETKGISSEEIQEKLIRRQK